MAENHRQGSEKVTVNASFFLLSGGDLQLAAFLSQIFYWTLPTKNNTQQTKLRVIIDGEYWLAKADKEWIHECFLTGKQVKRVKRQAIKLGLISTTLKKFNGNPTTHITLTENFEPALRKCNGFLLDYKLPETKKDIAAIIQELGIIKEVKIKKRTYKHRDGKTNPICTKGTYRKGRKGHINNDERDISLTESTTESTNRDNLSKDKCKSKFCKKKIIMRKIKTKQIKVKKNTPVKTDDPFPAIIENNITEILEHWYFCNGKVHQSTTAKGMVKIRHLVYGLLIPGLNSYSKLIDDTDLKSKQWTKEEIISCIDFYTGKLKKDISNFYLDKFIVNIIYATGKYARGIPDHSPLVESFEQIKSILPTEESAILRKRLGAVINGTPVPEIVFLNAAAYLEEIKNKYKVSDAADVQYKKRVSLAFVAYVKRKLNNFEWKINYISGASFGDEFLEKALSHGILQRKKARRVDGKVIYV